MQTSVGSASPLKKNAQQIRSITPDSTLQTRMFIPNFRSAEVQGRLRKEHAKEIQEYEEARDWLRSFYPDGKMTGMKTLKSQKEKLQQQIDSEKEWQ